VCVYLQLLVILIIAFFLIVPQKDDARVVLDREANDFIMLPGKNLKVAKPVLKSHEEL
jgi:hypothetical protein